MVWAVFSSSMFAYCSRVCPRDVDEGYELFSELTESCGPLTTLELHCSAINLSFDEIPLDTELSKRDHDFGSATGSRFCGVVV